MELHKATEGHPRAAVSLKEFAADLSMSTGDAYLIARILKAKGWVRYHEDDDEGGKVFITTEGIEEAERLVEPWLRRYLHSDEFKSHVVSAAVSALVSTVVSLLITLVLADWLKSLFGQ